MVGEIFVGVLIMLSVWFAYECGKSDCQKNNCYRGTDTDE